MYTITFYSFKGGVGRTLATLNVAMELVKRGKKIVLIDFDLEAPGLTSFKSFCDQIEIPGLIDFVADYLKEFRAPDVLNYIYNCRTDEGSGQLWILPAGKSSKDYSSRLSKIDWRTLYEEQQGYLLFEDLKQQIAQQIAPDYLLIDSRTGHTDVGGICTRQLPDSVVILFLPNDQNLDGLKKVVSDIRIQNKSLSQKNIEIHFVPSNVPNLDDEEGILSGRFEKFQQELNYEKPAAVIHHYDSFALLDQEIFVAARPHSSLAGEYRQLTDTLLNANMEDIEAAARVLGTIQAQISRPDRRGEASLGEIDRKLDAIAMLHPTNGEILYRIAIIKVRLDDLDNATSLVNAAIERGYQIPGAYLTHAQILMRQNEPDRALLSLVKALQCSNVSLTDVSLVANAMTQLQGTSLRELDKHLGELTLGVEQQLVLANTLTFNVEALQIGKRICESLREKAIQTRELAGAINGQLAVCLVGLGLFDYAITILNSTANEAIRIASENENAPPEIVRNLFNYSMALWGHTNELPVSELKLLIQITDPNYPNEQNFMQCMALAHIVIGNVEAANQLLDKVITLARINPRRTFSCWRYLSLKSNEFLEDIFEMKRLMRNEQIRPEFVRRHSGILEWS